MITPLPPALEELERLAVGYAKSLRTLGNGDEILEGYSGWSAADDHNVAVLLDSLLAMVREQQEMIARQGTAGGIAGAQLVEKITAIESLRVTVGEQQQEIERLRKEADASSAAASVGYAEVSRLRAALENAIRFIETFPLPGQKVQDKDLGMTVGEVRFTEKLLRAALSPPSEETTNG